MSEQPADQQDMTDQQERQSGAGKRRQQPKTHDQQEPPFDEWLAKAERRKTFSGFDWHRALRELRQRDEELERLRARVEQLEHRAMQLKLERDSAENQAAWTELRAGGK